MTQIIEHAVTPQLGRYDFDGQCAPHQPGGTGHWDTFTLAIFQWVAKAGARGKVGELKRTKTLERIKGLTAKPHEAYEKARTRCAILNQSVK